MKKLLSIVLALSFVLCASTVFAVSAAEVLLNNAGKGWTTERGVGWVYTSDDYLAYWKANTQYNTTYDWLSLKSGALAEGTITAKVSAKGNVGILFGGSSVAAKVGDGAGATEGVSRADGVKFILVSLMVNSTATSLELYYDYNDAEHWTGDKKVTVALNDTPENATKYGIDGTTDVEIKVDFTAAGKITAYVNGEKAIESTDTEYPTFGTEHGFVVRGAAYTGTDMAGYIKTYETAEPIPEGVTTSADWKIKTGGFASNNTGLFTFDYTKGSSPIAIYNGNIFCGKVTVRYNYEDVRAGSTPKKSIIFGAKGIKASAGTTAEEIQADDNTKFYRFVMENRRYWIEIIDADKCTSGNPDDWAGYLVQPKGYWNNRANGDDLDFFNAMQSNSQYSEFTIEWTEKGALKISLNGTALSNLTLPEGSAVPYGSEFGIVGYAQTTGSTTILGSRVVPTIAGGPDTGDSTSIYFIASAVALAAAFAVVCVARKKKVAE